MLALEATLLAWERDPNGGEIPCAQLASASRTDLMPQAEALARRLSAVAEGRAEIQVIETQATTGGRSAEDIRLDSGAVAIRPAPEEGSETALAAALRQGDPCVVGRLEDGQLLLDVRTLFPDDNESIERALRRWIEL